MTNVDDGIVAHTTSQAAILDHTIPANRNDLDNLDVTFPELNTSANNIRYASILTIYRWRRQQWI